MIFTPACGAVRASTHHIGFVYNRQQTWLDKAIAKIFSSNRFGLSGPAPSLIGASFGMKGHRKFGGGEREETLTL
jgi:hypothetical protein